MLFAFGEKRGKLSVTGLQVVSFLVLCIGIVPFLTLCIVQMIVMGQVCVCVRVLIHIKNDMKTDMKNRKIESR